MAFEEKKHVVIDCRDSVNKNPFSCKRNNLSIVCVCVWCNQSFHVNCNVWNFMGIKYILCKCIPNVFIVYTLWVYGIRELFCERQQRTHTVWFILCIHVTYICHELPEDNFNHMSWWHLVLWERYIFWFLTSLPFFNSVSVTIDCYAFLKQIFPPK